ncbi:efflux RND transporter permease subunit [Ferrimonas lipolytica]|uniref:Efflux RND transporter permease subunit n=1 Tax=Ferrimonas lipolytica TaxID=2724191 RepID=A0A6H1U996_9GAMM|nr:efflux RND transporter permease subunit [Ferrimonas lipolytica]QIZ75617.1 efflux RND transporter permease subunit [Ferrimonas lipolytica]
MTEGHNDSTPSRPAPVGPKPNGLISWFAANSVAANLLLVGVLVLGLLTVGDIRKEAFPSLEPSRVTVSVTYDSGDAQQAEEGIAIKIEDAIESVAGIKRITSTSNASGSTVVIEKTSSYDLDLLMDDVKTKVDAIYNFPADAENAVIEKATRQDHAITVQLYGDSDRRTLQALAEELKIDLLAKNGISEVEFQGKAEPMISIEVDENRLQSYNLTLTDIATAVNAESGTAIGTSLRNGDKVVRLKAAEQSYRVTDFANIVVHSSAEGGVIFLGDIADISQQFEDEPYVMSRFAGQAAIAIEIVMDELGDVTDIVAQANEVVTDWHDRGLLPAGVELVTWYDKSDLITDRLSLLTQNAITGIAMVFIVLALFLNLRVAFWVAMGLPFVFCGTLFFLGDNYAGMSLNEMTTFGFIMALGIVVDDAVVVGESIYSERRRYGDSLHNTIGGTMRVAVPTLFGVLTTVAAFYALSNVEGQMGKLYAQFATVVTICLLLSVVESKLILPSHLAHLDTHKKVNPGILGLWNRIQHGCDMGLQWFSDNIYRRVISWVLQLRYAVILGFITLFVLVVGLPLTGKVKVGFFPDIPGDTIVASVSMQTDAGYGLLEDHLLTLQQQALIVDNEMSDANSSGIDALQLLAESDSSGQVTIELSDDANYSSREFVKQWQQLAGNPEGVKKLKFVTAFEGLDNFKVELKASDFDILTAAGGEFRQALGEIQGVSGIDDNLSSKEPQFRFELTQQGRALGFTTSDLSRQILQTFGGEIVQRYQLDRDEVKVRIRYPEQQRQTLADVNAAKLRAPDGTIVALTDVVVIRQEMELSERTRIDSQSAVYLTASLDKEQLASNALVAQLQRDLVPQLQANYPSLSIHFAGEAEAQQESSESMAKMFLMALLGIYALLAIPLRSYVQPMLIMTAIPFGIVGAILGHWFNDLTISLLSLNGILALSGVVVNDSLLLVSRYNELRKDLHIKEAITEACTGRLRAVLLTSVTTFAGLAPLLSETSMQAQFLIPAAASLGYGILFATVITLVLIPSLLLIQEEIKALPKRFLNKPAHTEEYA